MRKLASMFVAMLTLSALILAVQTPSERPKVEGKIWWVFLNTGKVPSSKFEKEQVAKWQSEHVGNFGKRYEEGRLFAAGPLGDNGFIRGTVVIKAKDLAGVMDCFKTDPFVQNGLLDIEAYPLLAADTSFKKAKEPFVIDQFTIAIFKKGPKWTAASSPELTKQQADHVAGLMALMKSGDLAFVAPILDDNADKRGICVFWSKDEKEVKALLDKDSHVKAGHLVYETHPQYMGEGTFGERPKK